MCESNLGNFKPKVNEDYYFWQLLILVNKIHES